MWTKTNHTDHQHGEVLTPAPSTVRRKFAEKYENSPKHATQFYYQFSQITNNIRVDRIEKDPRDIIKAGMTKKSGYPAFNRFIDNL